MRASSQNPLVPNTFRIGFVLAWGGVFVATLVFLLAGITQQGFWEDPTSPTTPLTQQVPRQNPAPENTEIARVLQLEEPASTRWPLLTQWLLRGSARLGRLEIAARLPSLVCMISLAFLMILFLHRHGQPWESLLGVLALAATPAFLITGRTVNLEAPTVFFHTLFVLWGYEWITNGLHQRLWNFARLFGVFVATVLAGGWFWGAVVTLGALACALFFSKLASRRAVIVLCILTGVSLALLPLLYAINAPEWLVHAPNPASTIPTVKAPHALFTTYPVRVFFSTFPVSLIVLLAFLTVSDAPTDVIFPVESKEKQKQIVSLRFLASWLFMVVAAGAYWEMRVETAFFLGIFPLCAAAAVFLSRYIDILFQPLPSFVLALGGLVIIRDLATYPQILPELFTTAEIPSVKLRLGPALWPTVFAFTFPAGWVLFRSRHALPHAWENFWNESQISPLFGLFTLPLRFVGKGTAWVWHHRPKRGWIGHKIQVLLQQPHTKTTARVLFFAALLSFGGWFSLHVLSGLLREFSSRPAMATAALYARPQDGLAVYETSPRTAPLYTQRAAVVLSSDSNIAAFMHTSERNFLVFPSQLLGKIDFLSRTHHFHYHLLKTDSLAFSVATNHLPDGLSDVNPLIRFVFSDPPSAKYTIQSNLENALELVGYDTPRQVARGEFMTVRLVFRVERSLPAEYQVFIHLDPPYGTRITADHNPVQGLLPTRYFAPGTYVVDEYTFRIPRMGFPTGRYGLFAGLFSGNNRAKVLSGAHAGQNRIPLGTVEIVPTRWPVSCQ